MQVGSTSGGPGPGRLMWTRSPDRRQGKIEFADDAGWKERDLCAFSEPKRSHQGQIKERVFVKDRLTRLEPDFSGGLSGQYPPIVYGTPNG